MTLYVGNLAYATVDDDLRRLFSQYGEVVSASIAFERETYRPRGFGFVEMPRAAEAEAAIDALHDVAYNGRRLIVNVARPKTERYVERRRA